MKWDGHGSYCVAEEKQMRAEGHEVRSATRRPVERKIGASIRKELPEKSVTERRKEQKVPESSLAKERKKETVER